MLMTGEKLAGKTTISGQLMLSGDVVGLTGWIVTRAFTAGIATTRLIVLLSSGSGKVLMGVAEHSHGVVWVESGGIVVVGCQC